eukprot:TRINITY_DN36690_c0_g1_i1.p1 TRINITY_DN36690_c0_g1~~TRINITY_DN36690_c0_g1_i1.p1  ORF type:complete len:381 (-),score=104.64 TRINITY_DN36690_c0_g1_i1:355-1497(-)
MLRRSKKSAGGLLVVAAVALTSAGAALLLLRSSPLFAALGGQNIAACLEHHTDSLGQHTLRGGSQHFAECRKAESGGATLALSLAVAAGVFTGGTHLALRQVNGGGGGGDGKKKGVSLAATLGGSIDPSREYWLDFRKASVAMDRGLLASVAELSLEDFQETLKDFIKQLRSRLDSIGIKLGSGDVALSALREELGAVAILVDEESKDIVRESIKDVDIRLLYAKAEFEGIKVPQQGAKFVCDDVNRLPVAAVPAPPPQFGGHRRALPIDVWKFDWKQEMQAAKETADWQEEQMKVYEEGLEDPEKYVTPPPHRLREILDLPEFGSYGPLTKAGVYATAIPPNVLLWAKAVATRRKAQGESLSYSVGKKNDAPDAEGSTP